MAATTTRRYGLKRPLQAGALYFAVVFALGFTLALVRDGVLHLGESEATRLRGTLVEIPIVLTAAWFACRVVTRRCRVAPVAGERALMGATAFALLMLAEAATGLLLLGRTLEAHLATFRIPSYAVGLAAQMAFATFPWIQGRTERRPERAASARPGPAGRDDHSTRTGATR
jgi:hypothetical protein